MQEGKVVAKAVGFVRNGIVSFLLKNFHIQMIIIVLYNYLDIFQTGVKPAMDTCEKEGYSRKHECGVSEVTFAALTLRDIMTDIDLVYSILI